MKGARAGEKELRMKRVLTENLWEAAKAKKRGGEGHERRPKEETKRRRHETCAQGCFYGLARAEYARGTEVCEAGDSRAMF